MRLKRSAMRKCSNCKSTRAIDIRTDYGGARYCDRYAVCCESCDTRTRYFYTTKEALQAWEELEQK